MAALSIYPITHPSHMPYIPKPKPRPWLLTKEKSSKHGGRKERSPEYSTYRWQKFRAAYLAEHPLCVLCHDIDKRVVEATVCDHIKQVTKGGAFYDPENIRALCYTHHQRVSGLQRHGKVL
jgi:5-methylcytosine-specific restriction enzyme A